MEIDGGHGYSKDDGAEDGRKDAGDYSKETPARSVEGWVVIIRNIHEEASEEDITEAIVEEAEADVRNVHMNLDRRTGLVKGYCLVEFANKDEAERVVRFLDGFSLHGKAIKVDWAFNEGPQKFL